VGVGEDLHFDVSRSRQIALDVALGTPEVTLCLALGALQSGRRLICGVHDLHAATAAAVGRLDGDRPANVVAKLDDFFGVLQRLASTGHALDADFGRGEATGDLVTMTSMASGGGPMKVTPREVIARANSVFSEKNP